MSLNGENGKAVKHHLKYIKFLRDKKKSLECQYRTKYGK